MLCISKGKQGRKLFTYLVFVTFEDFSDLLKSWVSMGTFSLDHRLINQFVLKKFTFIVKKNWGILIHLLSIFMFFSKLIYINVFFFRLPCHDIFVKREWVKYLFLTILISFCLISDFESFNQKFLNKTNKFIMNKCLFLLSVNRV